MNETMTKTHQWVLVQYIPVEVEVDPNSDNLHTFIREGQEELAKEDGIIGCWHCNAKLTTTSYYEECPGEPLAD